MKIDFKEGETFTQDQFKKLVLENPDCICKPEDGGSEDMVTEKIPPCSVCAAEGYDLSVEKVEQITSDRSTDTKYELEEFDWLTVLTVIEEIFDKGFEITDSETGNVSQITVNKRLTQPYSMFTAAEIQSSQNKDEFSRKIIETLHDTRPEDIPLKQVLSHQWYPAWKNQGQM